MAADSFRVGRLRKLRYLLRHFIWVMRHPLNRPRPIATLARYLGWHLGSRMVPGAVATPYANGLRMLISTGGNAVGTVHFGFDEYAEQAFCAHLLRPGDLFVDVGASDGSYALLASGVAGARTLAFEPEPATARRLRDNLALNRLGEVVEVRESAVGAQRGTVTFTTYLRSSNRVVKEAEGPDVVKVPCTTLDAELATQAPVMLKIDVEGFEREVLEGAQKSLAQDTLLAVLLEDMALGRDHAAPDSQHRRMLDLGFRPYSYAPERRALIDLQGEPNIGGLNTLYLRQVEHVAQRVSGGAPIHIRGATL